MKEYRFISAIQFSTTVNGGTVASAVLLVNRNRCPSPVTSKLKRVPNEKSSRGVPAFTAAPSVTSTAISLPSGER